MKRFILCSVVLVIIGLCAGAAYNVAHNTITGASALSSVSTGMGNTGTGESALFGDTSGGYNTATGYNALAANTTGSGNVAGGYNAGTFISGGTAVNGTGSNSLFIGNNTRAAANAQTNQIVIGADATGNGSNTVTLGNANITSTILRGNVQVLNLNSTATQTTINGSSSGTIIWSQPFQGASYKRVVIEFNTVTDTGTTITYPSAFHQAPVIASNSTSLTIVTITNAAITIPATTETNGWIVLEGY